MANRIGIIVQRYGLEINGGAEYHARLIAERLARYFTVEVFTTTALDYVTWGHHYRAGREEINGITVNRFPVKKPRDPRCFGEIQNVVFHDEHSRADELLWLEEEGPLVPQLLKHLERVAADFDYLVFFSYRYYHSYWGLQKFPGKAILVPTAEHDEVIYMHIFKELFHQPAAIVYNSVEERELIQRVSANHAVPGDVVGVGSEIPAHMDAAAVRERFGLTGRYFIYIGRLDENKGVPLMLQHFQRLLAEVDPGLTLVLAGKSVIPIPDHPRIRYLGFISDQEKFDLLAGSEFLIIPSQYESLSMVSLEAWAVGKAVVANGRTEVLQGQCRRSNAGLWFTCYEEFREVILLLAGDPELCRRMGENGREFFRRHYTWDVIDGKYLGIISALEKRKSGT